MVFPKTKVSYVMSFNKRLNRTVLFSRQAVQVAASTVVTQQVEGEIQQSTEEKRDKEKIIEGLDPFKIQICFLLNELSEG